METIMKAVVNYGRGKGLIEIQEVPEPKIKEDEILIEVKAVSVFGRTIYQAFEMVRRLGRVCAI